MLVATHMQLASADHYPDWKLGPKMVMAVLLLFPFHALLHVQELDSRH